MFHAKLSVDLPSEVPPPPSAVKKAVGWLLGKKEDPDEGLEQLLLDNLTFFEAFLNAFGDAGFDDVVSVVVDGRPVYVDVEEKFDDFAEALDKTVHSGALEDGFSILRATFCRVEGGLRVLGELRVHARVPEGEAEATLRVSARPDDIELAEDEGPREYAARVRAYVRDADRIDGQRATVEGKVESLSQAIRARLSGAKVERGELSRQIVALGPKQVGRLRHLGFSAARRRTVGSALPSYERTGAYDNPLTLHYYSPYRDLFDWIALGEVLAGQWPSPDVRVVHPTGRLLFTGDRGASYDQGALEVPRDAVRVNAQGALVVDDSIPHVDAVDPAEAGSPHGKGWAGEEWTEDLGDG